MEKAYDFTRDRLTKNRVEEIVSSAYQESFNIPVDKLQTFLKLCKGLRVKLRPKNPSTAEIIGGVLSGAAFGAGTGMLLNLARVISGPLGAAAVAGALIGAGAGYVCVSYDVNIRIYSADDNGVHKVVIS